MNEQESIIREFVINWFKSLDEKKPMDYFLSHLDENFSMESQNIHSKAEFASIFDEHFAKIDKGTHLLNEIIVKPVAENLYSVNINLTWVVKFHGAPHEQTFPVKGVWKVKLENNHPILLISTNS